MKHKRAGKLQRLTGLFFPNNSFTYHYYFYKDLEYGQQILKVLTEAGEQGASVQAIAKHVYNMNTTFFYQPVYADIKVYVQQYLLRNSKSAQSIVESTGRRGYYRLNTKGSQDARQLMLQFFEAKEEEVEKEKPQQDLSLDLFDGQF